MHASLAVPPHGPVRSVQKPRRPAVAALAVIALAAALAACGSRAAGANSSPVEKPDMTVAVVPATGAAGAYIAARDGYFTAAGLQVKIVAVTSSADALAGLADGSIDLDGGQTSSFDAEVAGLRLHALARGNSGGPGLEQLMIPGHSPVTTVRQLAGKTIAVNALAGVPVLLTDMVLAENGVSLSRVHFAAITFPSIGAALAAHRVDAAFLTEPYLTQAATSYGAQPLLDLDQGATQNFPVTGYLVTQAWMNRYPRTAAAFSRALARGQALAATSRVAVEKALTRYTTISAQTAAVMALGIYPLDVTVRDLERVGDLMQQEHALKTSTNVTQLARELAR